MSKDLYFEMQQESIAKALTDIESGDIESLETYAYLDRIEKNAKKAKEQIKDIVLEQGKTYLEGNSKEFKKNGIKFSFKNGSTRYSFNGIKKYQEKKKELDSIAEQSKQAYLAKQKGILTANEDGEEIEFPEVLYTSDSVSIKFVD